MSLHIQSFTKGIDKDSSVNKYPNDAAYHIENFRFITDEGLTTMSLENIKGTSFSFQLPNGYLIWGHTTIRNTLVILAINPTKTANAGTDRIYTAIINENGTISNLTQKCQVELGFNINNKLTDVIGRYESEALQKIYWCDGINRMKFANIADINISTKPSEWFDYYAAFSPSAITVSNISSGGTLKSGMVQYAYQLYNLYGSQTFFTSPTSLYGLTSFNTSGSDKLFFGDSPEKNSGKQVNLQFTNLDTNFNRIKVVRLLHTNLLNDPEITIIYDGAFQTNFSLIDNGGQNLGTLTIAEFNFANYDFIPKNLETKNNILFASNVKENSWDVDYDARAYRFGPNGGAMLYAADGVSESILIDYSEALSRTLNVPETHDCYNTFNNFKLDNPNGEGFRYNSNYNGNQYDLGGQGNNIKYSFTTSQEMLDDTSSSSVVETYFQGNTNPVQYKTLRGFHRDEIYSFAIVLLNIKGQKSYIKWIGDIRFPRASDHSYFNITDFSGKYSNVLGISFEISNLPEDCKGFQIVRCERNLEDRTILGQGIVGVTREYQNNTTTFYCGFPTVSTLREYQSTVQPRGALLKANKTLVEFISPEVSYNKNLNYAGGDVLEICSIAYLRNKYIKGENDKTPFISNKNYNFNSPRAFIINKVTYSTTPTSKLVRSDVLNTALAEYTTNDPEGEIISATSISIGGMAYENYIRGVSGTTTASGRHGSVAIIHLEEVLDLLITDVNDLGSNFGEKYIICNYRRAIQPYGGASYEARSRRTYIPCGDIYPTPNNGPGNGYSISYLRDGDTFVSKFEYQRAMSAGLVGDIAKNETLVEAVLFPVETSINTRWQSNKTWTQEYSSASNIPTNLNAILIQEKAGIYSKDNNGVNNTYSQEMDLYSYNSVYSKENSSTIFTAKPLDLIEDPIYDTRIHYSDRKFNNENIDSWTIFRPLNFKDVDSSYGSINAAINYNHDFIFFQNNAIGIASIEERELLQSTTGTTSVIGQGGILSRFDYINTSGGCQDKDSIVAGRYRLYWYDKTNNSLFSFSKSEGVNNISKINGLHSFFNNIGVNNITDVISGVDPKYNDIYFTIKTTTGYYTLVYNEIGKMFTEFVTVDSDRYIEFENYLYSVKNNNQIYLHHSGDYGSFHGTLYPSKLTLIINPRQMLVNRFDILEFLTRVTSNGSELHETFTTLRIRDSYQDTGTIVLQDDTNIKERLRKWRFNSIWSTDEYNSRFKDSYVTVDLEFINDGIKHIVLSDVIMLYQESFSK